MSSITIRSNVRLGEAAPTSLLEAFPQLLLGGKPAPMEAGDIDAHIVDTPPEATSPYDYDVDMCVSGNVNISRDSIHIDAESTSTSDPGTNNSGIDALQASLLNGLTNPSGRIRNETANVPSELPSLRPS